MRPIIFRELSKRRFGVEIEVINTISKKALGQILNNFEFMYAKRLFGKELCVEVTSGPEGWKETNSNNYWHVKFDRSCGWEIASFIGSGERDADHIALAAKYLDTWGACTNSTCGLHIHAEVKDYTPGSMGVLLAYWLKIEHAMLAICDPSRRNNSHCIPLVNKYYDNIRNDYRLFTKINMENGLFVWNILKPTNFSPHNNNQRKVAINTIGFAMRQSKKTHSKTTVELRLPECILNKQHIKNWINLYVNFVDSCCNKQVPENLAPASDVSEILEILGLQSKNDFLILDDNLAQTKMWFLKKLAETGKNCYAEQANNTLAFVSQI